MEDDFINAPLQWGSKSHGKRVFEFDAFVSHAGGDRSREFVERLVSCGMKVWHDGSQEMGDARWRMRLVNALLRSRYVILVLEREHDILERDWVTAEWQSALEAERLSGVPRLAIAKWTEDVRVPPALLEHPGYTIGQHEADLAQVVIAGNVLACSQILENDLPTISMVHDSLTKVVLLEEDESTTRILFDLTKDALSEVQSDPGRPAYALYLLWLLSHDSQSLENLNLLALDLVVPALEVLAGIGHTEGRANSCFMLRALATRGCQAAGQALLRVTRREENGDVLRLIFGWFMEDDSLPPLEREDYNRILLVLPTEAKELADKAMSLAGPEAAPAKLRHFVFRVTNRYFDKLQPKFKHGEAESRFKLLLEKSATSIEWEIFFRGLSQDAKLKSQLINLRDSLPEASVATFLTLVERFADELVRRHSPIMWEMEYEIAVLRPVAIAYAFQQLGESPSRAYRKILKALEIPVLEDLTLLREWQGSCLESVDVKYACLLSAEMELRLTAINNFLEGPYLEKRDDGLIYVTLTDLEGQVDLIAAHEELRVQRSSLGDESLKHSVIAAIWERWRGVPLI